MSVFTDHIPFFKFIKNQGDNSLSALKFLFSTKGRVSRLPFILFVVSTRLVIEGAGYLARNQPPSTNILQYVNQSTLISVFALIVLWPAFVITVKRLHDINWSFIPALGYFLPFPIGFLMGHLVLINDQSPSASSAAMLNAAHVAINIVYFYILLLIVVLSLDKGTKGRNRYGPDPKGKGDTAEAVL